MITVYQVCFDDDESWWPLLATESKDEADRIAATGNALLEDGIGAEFVVKVIEASDGTGKWDRDRFRSVLSDWVYTDTLDDYIRPDDLDEDEPEAPPERPCPDPRCSLPEHGGFIAHRPVKA